MSVGHTGRSGNPRRSRIHATIVAAVLVTIAPALHAATEIRVGLHDAKPVVFRNAEGEPSGLMVDILEHIAELEDLELHYVYGSWAECLERLEKGEIDLLFPILPSPQREQRFDFGRETTFSSWGRIFTRPDRRIDSILDLQGTRVAVVRDDHFNHELQKLVAQFGLRCVFEEVTNVSELFEAVVSGRADAAAIEDKSGYWSAMNFDVVHTPVVFSPSAPRLAVPKGQHAELLAAIDDRLAELKSDRSSVYYHAYESWFGRQPSATWPRWLVLSLGIAAGLLVLLAAFIIALRMQVRARTREVRLHVEQLEQEIFDRRAAEEERERLGEMLRHAQKMEAMGTLAAGVAHDFNNLLMLLSAHATLVKRKVAEDEELSQSLQVMEDAVEQATGFTRSLLTFSHKLPPLKKPLDFRATVAASTRVLRRTLPASIDLRVETEGAEPVWIDADESQLQQIVLNLAVNARDAMPDGGTLRIAVDVAPSGDARLSVSDTGLGIPERLRPRIFDPFFTTKPRGQGTGLGLAVVHGIVNEHGGRVDVHSAEAEGTTFEVSFPKVAADTTSVDVESTGAQASGSGELILLAEDDQQIREVLAAYLTSRGFRVEQAGDGPGLLERFMRHRQEVQLLILDVELPKTSGLSVLRSIRKTGARTPAILLSGGVGDEIDPTDPEFVLLHKPFRLNQLGELVAGLLRPPRRRPA